MRLEISGLTVIHGKAVAVEDVSLTVEQGSAVCLVGANGAGKSTVLRAVSGLVPVAAGTIRFGGERIDGLPAPEIVARGLVHVPEGRRLFPWLSVMANLRLGATLRRDRAGVARDLAQVFADFPRLEERRHQLAGTLSGGEQQMLAIGRALMAGPRLLMLDEPSLGLAPIVVADLVPVLRDINRRGVGLLIAEQNLSLALAVADWGHALQLGRIVLSAPGAAFRDSAVLRRAYLG